MRLAGDDAAAAEAAALAAGEAVAAAIAAGGERRQFSADFIISSSSHAASSNVHSNRCMHTCAERHPMASSYPSHPSPCGAPHGHAIHACESSHALTLPSSHGDACGTPPPGRAPGACARECSIRPPPAPRPTTCGTLPPRWHEHGGSHVHGGEHGACERDRSHELPPGVDLGPAGLDAVAARVAQLLASPRCSGGESGQRGAAGESAVTRHGGVVRATCVPSPSPAVTASSRLGSAAHGVREGAT